MSGKKRGAAQRASSKARKSSSSRLIRLAMVHLTTICKLGFEFKVADEGDIPATKTAPDPKRRRGRPKLDNTRAWREIAWLRATCPGLSLHGAAARLAAMVKRHRYLEGDAYLATEASLVSRWTRRKDAKRHSRDLREARAWLRTGAPLTHPLISRWQSPI